MTAFLRTQDWGINPFQWPPKVFQLTRTRSTEPTYRVPIWIWQGVVILDHEGFPMLDFKDLPATISSHENGSILEGIIREDPRITDRDIAVRMPWGYTYMTMEPIVDAETVGLRRALFRNAAGCISWQETQPVRALASPFVSPVSRHSRIASGEWLLDQPLESDPSQFVSSADNFSGTASGEWLLDQPLESDPSQFVSSADNFSGTASVGWLLDQPLESDPSQIVSPVDSFSGMASVGWLLDQQLESDPSQIVSSVGNFSGMASGEWLLAQPVELAEPYRTLTTGIEDFEIMEDVTERDIEFDGFSDHESNSYYPLTPG
ncbi:MAG: hypothetical protein Q9214_002546 [Letrouitia sp. 1 TL-2023]